MECSAVGPVRQTVERPVMERVVGRRKSDTDLCPACGGTKPSSEGDRSTVRKSVAFRDNCDDDRDQGVFG